MKNIDFLDWMVGYKMWGLFSMGDLMHGSLRFRLPFLYPILICMHLNNALWTAP